MKNKFKRAILGLGVLSILAVPLSGLASSPERHVAYRYAWGCKATTEWSGVRHYTRTWIEPIGTDSGRKYGVSLSEATAFGDALFNTAHSRYGRD